MKAPRSTTGALQADNEGRKINSRSRSSSATIFALKMQLAFAIWKRRDLSPAARLVFTVLMVGHHNVETGKCNPSYQTLAKECGMTRRAVIRIISALAEKGLIAIKVSVGGNNTNSFSFPALQMVIR